MTAVILFNAVMLAGVIVPLKSLSVPYRGRHRSGKHRRRR